ncbi:MAG: hypothetical protein IJR45_08660, partial [Firmicutes bacterium]|nr:hypothetical protein [Bacillota bacterium]
MKKRIFAFITAVLMSANTVLAADGFWQGDKLEASVRDVYEELGKEVVWDAENKTASVDGKIFVSADGIAVNGENIGGTGTLVNGRMYAPAEFLAKSLGAEFTSDDNGGVISFNGAQAVISTAEEQAEEWKYGGGTPWVDSNLKENIDKSVSLKDDFNMAVNADWMLDTEIPAGYSRYMKELSADTKIASRLRKFFTDKSIKGKNAELVQSLYSALLDWDARAKITQRFKDDIKDIESISSLEELNEYLLYTDEETKYPASPFVDCGISVIFSYSSKYVFVANDPGIILEDAAEYDEMSEYGEKIYEGKKQLVEKIMGRYGYTKEQADDYFESALEWESLIAPVLFTNEEVNSPDILEKIFKNTTMDALYSDAGAYPLKAIVEGLGLEASNTVVEATPGYVKHIGRIYNEDNLEIIKADLIVGDVLASLGMTDKETLDDYFDYVESVMGVEMSGYADYAANKVKGSLSEVVAELYVEKYGNDEVKAEVTQLCKEIIDEYKIMLNENDWLTDQTKKKAVEKLDSIKINVAYPDKFRDYSSLDFKGKDLYEISLETADFVIEQERSRVNGTVDRSYWSEGMSPLDVNACYSSQDNSINIFLGEIEALYDPSQGLETLYAGLGTTIGHEISHAFDPMGAQFDKDG